MPIKLTKMNRYYCPQCGKIESRESEKKWITSHCDRVGKSVRLQIIPDIGVGAIVETNRHYDKMIKALTTQMPMPGHLKVIGVKANSDGSRSLRFSDEKIQLPFGKGDCMDYDWTNECYFSEIKHRNGIE